MGEHRGGGGEKGRGERGCRRRLPPRLLAALHLSFFFYSSTSAEAPEHKHAHTHYRNVVSHGGRRWSHRHAAICLEAWRTH